MSIIELIRVSAAAAAGLVKLSSVAMGR